MRHFRIRTSLLSALVAGAVIGLGLGLARPAVADGWEPVQGDAARPCSDLAVETESDGDAEETPDHFDNGPVPGDVLAAETSPSEQPCHGYRYEYPEPGQGANDEFSEQARSTEQYYAKYGYNVAAPETKYAGLPSDASDTPATADAPQETDTAGSNPTDPCQPGQDRASEQEAAPSGQNVAAAETPAETPARDEDQWIDEDEPSQADTAANENTAAIEDTLADTDTVADEDQWIDEDEPIQEDTAAIEDTAANENTVADEDTLADEDQWIDEDEPNQGDTAANEGMASDKDSVADDDDADDDADEDDADEDDADEDDADADDDADEDADEDDDEADDEVSDRSEDAAAEAGTDATGDAGHGQDGYPYGCKYSWPYSYKYRYGYGHEPGTSASQANDSGAEAPAEPSTTDSPTTAGYQGYSPAYPEERYAYPEPGEDAATQGPAQADSNERGTETTENVTQPDGAAGTDDAMNRQDATEADDGGESAVTEKPVTNEPGEAAPCPHHAGAYRDVYGEPSGIALEQADGVAVSAAGRSLRNTWVTLVVDPLKAAMTVTQDLQPRLSLPGWARMLYNSIEGNQVSQGVVDGF